MCGCPIINMWLQLLLHWLGLFHLVLRGKWAYTWVKFTSTPTASLRTTYMCNYPCHLESKGCGVLRGCMGEHCKEFTSWAEQIPWSRVHICARRWVSDSLTVLGPTCGHLFQLGPQPQRTSESWPFQLQIHLHPPTLGGLCLLSPHTPATHPVLMEPENMPIHARAYAILGPNTLCVIGKLRPQRGRHWFRAQYVGRRDFPASSEIKNSPASAGEAGDVGSVLELGRFPLRRKWQPMPVFLPGESHGQKMLVGCSPGVAKSWTRLSNWVCMCVCGQNPEEKWWFQFPRPPLNPSIIFSLEMKALKILVNTSHPLTTQAIYLSAFP